MSSFVANVLRARDLFHAQFEFINLVIDAAVANNPVLKRASAGAAYIVVRLPPQSIVEAEFLPDGTRNLPYNAVLSGPSRLAFELPQMLEPIQFNLCALLERLTQLEPLTSGAAPSASPATLIEYPDRLLLAPETKVRLAHRRTPLAKSDPKTDLAWSAAWHTRILEGTPVPNRGVRFRAVGNASIDTADRLPGTTLNKEKRGEIARLCAASAADPHLIAASQFMLTALGTSARMKSRWPTSASPVLSAWEHETVVGRDRFVRTLEQGFLFPFGHRASLETIAQREFYRLLKGHRASF